MSQSETNTQDGIESKVEQTDPKPRKIWTTPRPEIDKYGVPTGSHYVECRECGAEAMTGDTDKQHREGCEHREDQQTPTVSPCRSCSELSKTEYCSSECRKNWEQRDTPL